MACLAQRAPQEAPGRTWPASVSLPDWMAAQTARQGTKPLALGSRSALPSILVYSIVRLPSSTGNCQEPRREGRGLQQRAQRWGWRPELRNGRWHTRPSGDLCTLQATSRQAPQPVTHLLHITVACCFGETHGVQAEVPEQLVIVVSARRVLQGWRGQGSAVGSSMAHAGGPGAQAGTRGESQCQEAQRGPHACTGCPISHPCCPCASPASRHEDRQEGTEATPGSAA